MYDRDKPELGNTLYLDDSEYCDEPEHSNTLDSKYLDDSEYEPEYRNALDDRDERPRTREDDAGNLDASVCDDSE